MTIQELPAAAQLADPADPMPLSEGLRRTFLEYWIPAEDLPQLNANIVGRIDVTAEFG